MRSSVPPGATGRTPSRRPLVRLLLLLVALVLLVLVVSAEALRGQQPPVPVRAAADSIAAT